MAITQNSADISYHYPGFRKLKTWLLNIIRNEGYTAGDISLVFCSDQFLREMNLKYLGHDYYTDILTFDYGSGKIIAGDIFISIERIGENAILLETDFNIELDRVISHGILHLAGYKDSNSAERKVMRAREDYYLARRI